MEPNLLTIKEASDYLRVPVATLRYYRSLGVGPRSFLVGRRVLYKRIDCDAYLEQAYNRPLRT